MNEECVYKKRCALQKTQNKKYVCKQKAMNYHLSPCPRLVLWSIYYIYINISA